MRYRLLILFFLTPNLIFSQNWIERKSFIKMAKEYDLVLVAKIDNIDTVELKNSTFITPLKKAKIEILKSVKGKTNFSCFFYRDIYNGCGYAPILVQNHNNDTILLFANIRNDSIFQAGVLNQNASEFSERITDFFEINNEVNKINRVEYFKNWIIKCMENEFTLEKVNDIINYEEDFQFTTTYLAINDIELTFSDSQKQIIYNYLRTSQELSYKNRGIVKLLQGINDEEYINILKGFMIKLRNDPYIETGFLMECIALSRKNKKLNDISTKYNNDFTIKVRLKLIKEFISHI